MDIRINKDLTGSILDIGGGGEGVIGQIYGDSVIAIDNSQKELDEAPDRCEKQLMDATALSFPDASFDNVTFFYSLMFMTREAQRDAIREAARVLKTGGSLCVWDTDIVSAWPVPYIVDLNIHSESTTIHTSYGIIKKDSQDSVSIASLLREAGLSVDHFRVDHTQFYIRCRK